jgi:hypothetical protein
MAACRLSVCQAAHPPRARHQQSYKNSILSESAFYGRSYENPHCLIEDANKKPAFNLLCRASHTRECKKRFSQADASVSLHHFRAVGSKVHATHPPHD